MVSSGEGPDEVTPSGSQKRDSPDSQTNAPKPIHYSNEGVHALQNQDEIPPCDVPEKALDYAGGRILQLDKEGSVSSITPPKVSQTFGTGSHSLQSGQEGRTPSIMREKVSEDGYHWRKYGQKLVKGNEFVRSYYKCTHPSCHVKKQLECSHDGKITDIVYLGEHEHPKAQLNPPQAAGFVLSVVEEKPEEPSVTNLEVSQTPHPIESVNTSQLSTVTSCEDVKSVLSESNRIRDEVDNDDDPRPKRRKKGNYSDDPTTVDKTTGEPRLVVQTLSEVDFVNDGYRWRKYGQKKVKGNPNPRSYYRCSSLGCPVKKHVERASHDTKVVITSYEGQHDHDMPPSRTVTHNTTGVNACTTAIHNGESGAKSGERRPTSLDLVACNTLDSNINLKEKLNSESGSKSKGNNSGHESTSSEQKKSNSGELKENGAAGLDMVVNTYSVPVEQHIGESRIEAKEASTACGVRTVTLSPETSPNEHIPNSEPVQS